MWLQHASTEAAGASRWPEIVGACVSLTTVTTMTVLLRVWIRASMVRLLGLDDFATIFAVVCSIVYNAVCIAQTRFGLGIPMNLRSIDNIDAYSVLYYSGRPFYQAGITAFKVALCIACLRMNRGNVKLGYKQFTWAVMSFTITSHFAGLFVLLFQCSPVKKAWKPLTTGTCLPNDQVFYALSAITISCDAIIFLMPVPMLMHLQIEKRKKIALIGVFLLGAFTTACSIMRMLQIILITDTGDTTMLILWGSVEMNVGIFLTCLPSLMPLFKLVAIHVGKSKCFRTITNTFTGHSHRSRSLPTMRPRTMSHINTVNRPASHVVTPPNQITKTTEFAVHSYARTATEYEKPGRWAQVESQDGSVCPLTPV